MSSSFQKLIKVTFERSLSQRKVFLTGDLLIAVDNAARCSKFVYSIVIIVLRALGVCY